MVYSLRILVVCTANVCRSPVVERLLERKLRSFGVPAEVRSAGTIGGRLSVHRHTVAAARGIGIDISNHRSRRLTADMVHAEGRDLVIAMTGQHISEIVALASDVLDRTFTLPELAHRAKVFGADPLANNLQDWLNSISTDRAAPPVAVSGGDQDVTDPYGGPAREHRKMVEVVAGFVDDVVVPLAASFDPSSV